MHTIQTVNRCGWECDMVRLLRLLVLPALLLVMAACGGKVQPAAQGPGPVAISSAVAVCSDAGVPAVQLVWTASERAEGYMVLRDGETAAELPETALSHTDADALKAGQGYSYVVESVNAVGRSRSPAATLTVPADICTDGEEDPDEQAPTDPDPDPEPEPDPDPEPEPDPDPDGPLLPGAPLITDVALSCAADLSLSAAFTWSGAEDVTGYSVLLDGAEVSELPAGTTVYSLESLETGVEYSVVIDASNEAGSASSEPWTFEAPVNLCFVGDVGDRFAAGRNHVIYVAPDGTVRGWGSNFEGQLLAVDEDHFEQPVTVPGLTDVTAVATDWNWSAAIDAQGDVWIWGDLPDEFASAPGELLQLELPGPAVRVVTAFNHLLILMQDGAVFAAGNNRSGQLGDGDVVPSAVPVQVTGISHATDIAAGSHFSVALLKDGQVLAWGDNFSGQLAQGEEQAFLTVPTAVDLPGPASGVAAGEQHVLALLDDGRVFGWGDDSRMQATGNFEGPTVVRTPTDVGLSNISAVHANGHASAAFAAGGETYHWGQWRTGYAITSMTPQVLSAPGSTVWADSSANTTFAVSDDGRVHAWGSNNYGLIGHWLSGMQPDLHPTAFEEVPYRLEVSSNHGLAIMHDGRLYSWGANGSGQLGLGHDETQTVAAPELVTGLPAITDIAVGRGYSVAVTANGHVFSWGENTLGRLGHGLDDEVYVTPGLVPGLPPIKQVAAGDNHVLALAVDGTVYAWGSNSMGQIGKGDLIEPTTVPVRALSGEFTSVAAAGDTSFAVTAGGFVLSWGANQTGLLGRIVTGEQSPYPSLVRLPAGSSVASVAVAGTSAFALLEDGRVFAWGSNQYRVAPFDARNVIPEPVELDGLGYATQVVTGGRHHMAVLLDGRVRVWGTAPLSVVPGVSQIGAEYMWLNVINDPELLSLGYSATFAAQAGGPLEVSGYDSSSGMLARGNIIYSQEPLLAPAVEVALP